MNINNLITPRTDSDQRWLAMRDENIFITGGSGLFGRWLITAILDANQRLGTNIKATVLTRNPDAFFLNNSEQSQQHNITLLKGDVCNFVFPNAHFSRILHMATTSAEETFSGQDQLSKFHLLTQGTERVLQFANVCRAKKVLFTSSGVVYGPYPNALEHVPENYLGAPNSMDPNSALAQGKRAAEFLCSYYAQKHQFEVTIARCFSFVGPGLPLDLHYAIGNFVRDALYAKEIIVKGDGSPMRSFLYLEDLTHWLLALLIDGKSEQVYNVGSDQAISIKDLAYLVRDVLSPNKDVVILGSKHADVGNFNRSWYVPNIDRARTELGLEVWTPLKSAIVKNAQMNAGNTIRKAEGK